MDNLAIQYQMFPADVVEDLTAFKEILKRHGAKKVILYGSMARGDFKPDSDIDLSVEGIPDDRYFRALAECLMHAKRRFNLIDLKTAKGYFRNRILNEGKLIYEG